MTTRQRVLGLGLSWLVAVWIVASSAGWIFPAVSAGPNWSYDIARRVTPLTRWDSGWYLNLAEAGYGPPPSQVGEETNHAFFPLYPLLVRGIVRSTGLETSHAGNLVSALSFLAALLLFADWTERHYGEGRVVPATLVLLVFPTSFFFAAVYTESLLLALSLAAVTAFERRRFAPGALAGFLTGLTRISGLVLAPYLALVAYRAQRDAGRTPARALAAGAVAAAAPLAGFGVFCLYFARRFGDPLLFVRAQHNWSGQSKSILDGPALILKGVVEDVQAGRILGAAPARTLEGLYLVLFALLALLLVRERRLPEAFYVTCTVAIVFASGTLESAGRYVLPAFPAFAALASWAPLRNRAGLFAALLALSGTAGIAYVWAFVHGYWTG